MLWGLGAADGIEFTPTAACGERIRLLRDIGAHRKVLRRLPLSTSVRLEMTPMPPLLASPRAFQRRLRQYSSRLPPPAAWSLTLQQGTPAGREASELVAAAAALRRARQPAAWRAAKLCRCLRAALGSCRRVCGGGRATAVLECHS